MKGNDMKGILHSQKHTAPHMEARESKLEASKGGRGMSVTPEQRHQMVAEVAYQRAQKRNFVGGDPENDWYEAEEEIGQLLFQPATHHNEPPH
jgi:hypothetical protein